MNGRDWAEKHHERERRCSQTQNNSTSFYTQNMESLLVLFPQSLHVTLTLGGDSWTSKMAAQLTGCSRP